MTGFSRMFLDISTRMKASLFRAEHEPVLGSLFRITSDPAIRVEGLWVRIDFWVVQSRIQRRNDHGACR